MSVNLVVAVTDEDWFDLLRQQANLGEVNFWAPSAANFRALQPGEMLLTPSGHGVISEIAENRPNEFLSIRHLGYISNEGVEDTSSEAIRAWAPAYENFTFTDTPQGTTLTVDQDMTDEFDSMPEHRLQALKTLKALCESGAR